VRSTHSRRQNSMPQSYRQRDPHERPGKGGRRARTKSAGVISATRSPLLKQAGSCPRDPPVVVLFCLSRNATFAVSQEAASCSEEKFTSPPRNPRPGTTEGANSRRRKNYRCPPGTCLVGELTNKNSRPAHISGKMRKRFIRVTVGDGSRWKCLRTMH